MDVDHSPSRKNNDLDDDIQITVRYIMQGKEVGSIIGKNGETVKKLREESGSKIYISDSSSPERIVTVIGSLDNLFRAFSLITKNIEEFYINQAKHQGGNAGDNQHIQLRLILPASQCGSIIGKGGAQIKTIRETSGAYVYVASDMLPNSTEREVTIKGAPEPVTQAVYQICLIMVDVPPKGATVPYRPMPSNAGPGLLGNQYGMQNNMMGGHDMGNSALAGLAALGLGNAGGLGNGPAGINAATLAALASSQVRGPPRGNQNNRNQRDAKPNNQQNQITKEMTVPNDLIGAVIGKGGTKIFEIRRISGAMIRIAKSSENEDSESTDRLITMTGTPDSIALAQYLINMSVELLKSHLDGDNGDSRLDAPSGGGLFGDATSSGGPPSLNNSSNPLVAALPQLAQLLNKPGALNALSSLSTLGGLSDLIGAGGAGPGGHMGGHVPNFSNVSTTGVRRGNSYNKNRNNGGGRSHPY